MTGTRRFADPPRRSIQRIGFAALCVALLSAQSEAPSYGPAELDEAFGKNSLVISASSGACYHFDIWLATERAQQSRGLMFVRNLPADAGMLFIYEGPGRRSMWMKNTYLPLDILFIRDDGSITNIEADTEPLSLRSISSSEPVTYVLELNAGVSAELGIVAGDQMIVFTGV